MQQGLQAALWTLGGAPQVVRSDNTSAATHEMRRSGGRALKDNYAALLDHYGLRSTRINRGQSHENGVAEQGHYRLKDAIDQALMLRGSRDSEPPPANSPASGLPVIRGAAQVGETLTADTSGLDDADGLENAVFNHQWLADGSDIAGATGSTYTLAGADEGRTISVRVTFTDDAGHDETLTSTATAAVAGLPPEPLTVTIEAKPSSHDGQNTFTFELRFSEEPVDGFSYTTMQDHAFTVEGGSVDGARRLDAPSNVGWAVNIMPDGSGAVTVVLPVTTDCTAEGAILPSPVRASRPAAFGRTFHDNKDIPHMDGEREAAP